MTIYKDEPVITTVYDLLKLFKESRLQRREVYVVFEFRNRNDEPRVLLPNDEKIVHVKRPVFFDALRLGLFQEKGDSYQRAFVLTRVGCYVWDAEEKLEALAASMKCAA